MTILQYLAHEIFIQVRIEKSAVNGIVKLIEDEDSYNDQPNPVNTISCQRKCALAKPELHLTYRFHSLRPSAKFTLYFSREVLVAMVRSFSDRERSSKLCRSTHFDYQHTHPNTTVSQRMVDGHDALTNSTSKVSLHSPTQSLLIA